MGINLDRYIDFIEHRILRDEWRVGWFKSFRNVDINGFKCMLLIYGHSRHFKTKGFIFPRLQLPYLFPYGAAAMLFAFDEVDINLIERVLDVVREYMRGTLFKTPENVEWDIDVAYVAIASKSIDESAIEYIEDVYKPEVLNQYMMCEGSFGKIVKRIGLVLIDLNNRRIYSANDMFSKEARRLFNPKPSIAEKIIYSFKKNILNF